MRYLLASLILVVTIPFVSAAGAATGIPIPEYLGAFALPDSTLIELEPFAFDVQAPASKLFPTHLENAQGVRIVLYGDYSPSAIKLNRVSSSHRVGALDEQAIQVRVKPQSGLQGLIGSLVLIEPRTTLEPGYYVLSIAETENAWGFNLAATSPFFMDPVYAVCEMGGDVIAGTGNGLLVYSNNQTKYLAIPRAKELNIDFKVGKIRYAKDGAYASADGGRIVFTLPSDGSGGGYLAFRLTDGKVVPLSFPELKNGWIPVSIAKYYDVWFPSRDPDFPFFGMTAYDKDKVWEEKIGLFACPKKAKSFLGMEVDVSVNGPGAFSSSDYFAVQLGKRIFCFAEATPDTILIGTDGEIVRLIFDAKKSVWNGLDKISGSPKSTAFLSRGVSGTIFAIDMQKNTFVSSDAGVSWKICDGIAGAEKIDVAPDNPRAVAYVSQGKLYISSAGGENFAPVSVDAQQIIDVKYSDAGQGRMFVGTDTALYRSADGGQTWRPVGE